MGKMSEAYWNVTIVLAVVLFILVNSAILQEVRGDIKSLNKTIKQNQHRESINDFIEKCQAAKDNGFGVAYSFDGNSWELCGEVDDGRNR